MELKFKGKGIMPLVNNMKVKIKTHPEYGPLPGLGIYDTKDLIDNEFDVIALGTHTYEDRSTVGVAYLDTVDGIREIALDRLIVVEKS